MELSFSLISWRRGAGFLLNSFTFVKFIVFIAINHLILIFYDWYFPQNSALNKSLNIQSLNSGDRSINL